MARLLPRLLPLPLLLAATLPAQAPANALPADRGKGALTITVPDLKGWLATLTSEEFGGRGTGQDGFKLAAEFVRDHFQALKLEPGGDQGSYWQKVPWAGAEVDAAATSLTFSKDGKEVLKVPAARLSGFASASMSGEGPVTLLVLKAPEGEGRRLQVDLSGIEDADLKDKVVLVHVQGTRSPMTALAVQSALSGKGARAVLTAETDAVTGPIQGRAGAGRGAGRAAAGARMSPASLSFGGDDLKALLAAAGVDRERLLGEPGALALSVQAAVAVAVKEQDRPAFNVVGILRGSDPKLKDEYVVIGSHLDHLGKRGDTYFPGADDDGSGTVGVMAVARAFTSNPVPPKRSVLFVTFCGEENGLVGSRFFVDNCPIPLGSIVAELQMDMIGRDEENARTDEKAEDNRNSVHLVGTQKISRDLHELCLQKNEVAGLDLEWDEEGVFSRSDHACFAAKGIPIAFFFTGFHADYHRPTDTPDKIHYEKLARIATWVYDIAFELCQQEGRPLVDPDLWESNRRSVRGVETPVAPMREKDK